MTSSLRSPTRFLVFDPTPYGVAPCAPSIPAAGSSLLQKLGQPFKRQAKAPAPPSADILKEEESFRWTAIPAIFPVTGEAEKPAAGLEEIRMLQWNVWFDKQHLIARSKDIISYLSKLNPPPSILALQEVTRPLYALIQASPFFQRNYLLSDFERQLGQTGSFYGVVLAVRKDFVQAAGGTGKMEAWEVGQMDMRSRFGRKLVGLDLPEIGLRISTSHFESPPADPAIRAHQFRLATSLVAEPFLPSSSTFSSTTLPSLSIITGDMNTTSAAELEPFTSPLWRDAFAETHPSIDAENDPSAITFSLTYPPTGHPLSRLDRVYYLGEAAEGRKEWEAASSEIFGKDLKVEAGRGGGNGPGKKLEDPRGREGKVWLSDHEGTLTVFRRVKS